ncbi:MAG: hypothetical protein SFY80_03145 [Verrucomicrobiota bacterium]|nr:hypothetical protein [Verrucomicrobiota bacterium]
MPDATRVGVKYEIRQGTYAEFLLATLSASNMLNEPFWITDRQCYGCVTPTGNRIGTSIENITQAEFSALFAGHTPTFIPPGKQVFNVDEKELWLGMPDVSVVLTDGVYAGSSTMSGITSDAVRTGTVFTFPNGGRFTVDAPANKGVSPINGHYVGADFEESAIVTGRGVPVCISRPKSAVLSGLNSPPAAFTPALVLSGSEHYCIYEPDYIGNLSFGGGAGNYGGYAYLTYMKGVRYLGAASANLYGITAKNCPNLVHLFGPGSTATPLGSMTLVNCPNLRIVDVRSRLITNINAWFAQLPDRIGKYPGLVDLTGCTFSGAARNDAIANALNWNVTQP